MTLFTPKPKGMQKKYPSEPTLVPLSHPRTQWLFSTFILFKNFTLPSPQAVSPSPYTPPVHGWQPTPSTLPPWQPHQPKSPHSYAAHTADKRQQRCPLSHHPSLPPLNAHTHSDTHTHTRGRPRLAHRCCPCQHGNNSNNVALPARIFFSFIFPAPLPTPVCQLHHPLNPPPHSTACPLSALLRTQTQSAAKHALFFVRFSYPKRRRAHPTPSAPPLPQTNRPTNRPFQPAFFSPCRRKTKATTTATTHTQHSPSFPPPSLFNLAHRIALSASGVALRRVVVVVVAAFLLATRKKSNKNNCHSPRTALHHRSLRHAALPSTNGLPTRLQLTSHSRSQLNSTHLTSHPKSQPNPPHSNTPLTIPPSPAPPHVACPMPPKPFTKLGTQLFVNSSAAAIRFGHG